MCKYIYEKGIKVKNAHMIVICQVVFERFLIECRKTNYLPDRLLSQS